MKNNKQHKDWFTSPFPQHPNQFTKDRLLHFQNKQNQLEESIFFKNQLFAPITPCHFLFGQSPQKNGSPWSQNLKVHQFVRDKIEQFNFQNSNASGSSKSNAIQHKLNFNQQQQQIESQQQPLRTPIKQGRLLLFNEMQKKEYHQQVDTTAKKSQNNESSNGKKCRPKQKGLRKLSQRAFQIVMTLKSVTYKDVATKLVQQLKESNQLQNQIADQQNVKRRVYDALNVLIASNVLKRDGRRIKLQKKQKQKSLQENISYLQQLKSNIALHRFRIKQKKHKRHEIQKKFRLIKLLMKRNRQQKTNSRVISFPFIGAFTPEINEDKIQFETRKQFSINLKEPTIPFGDIDSILYLQNSLLQK